MGGLNNNLLSNTPKSPMQKVEKLMEYQAIIKDLKPKIDELKADLLKITQDLDVYTLKTGRYTISRAKKITPKVINFKQLKESLDKAQIPYITEEVFAEQMKLVFKQAIEEKRELEGLEGLVTEYISIRIKESKEK